jgi:hypothetical protein
MAEEDEKSLAPLGATKEEFLAAYDGPAPWANKVLLTLTPVTGRLSFLELSSDAPPKFRAAVTTTISDLVALRDLLNKMLKDVRQLPSEGDDGSKS